MSTASEQSPKASESAKGSRKRRRKVADGPGKMLRDFLQRTGLNDDIEEFISTGHKINAIKIYRQQMDDIYGVKVGLREAKDYIDNIQADMKRRGMV